MKTAIYKYELTDRNFFVTMPANAEILKAGRQRPGVITLWAKVDPLEKSQVIRKFEVLLTGENRVDIDRYQYLDTVFDGSFVLHVFEDTTARRAVTLE